MANLDYVLACGHRRFLWECTILRGSDAECIEDKSHGWQEIIGATPSETAEESIARIDQFRTFLDKALG